MIGSSPSIVNNSLVQYVKELLRLRKIEGVTLLSGPQPLCFKANNQESLELALNEMGFEFKRNEESIILEEDSVKKHFDEAKRNSLYFFVWDYLKTLPYNLNQHYQDMLSFKYLKKYHQDLIELDKQNYARNDIKGGYECDPSTVTKLNVFEFDNGIIYEKTMPSIRCLLWCHHLTAEGFIPSFYDMLDTTQAHPNELNAPLESKQFELLAIESTKSRNLDTVYSKYLSHPTFCRVSSAISLAQINSILPFLESKIQQEKMSVFQSFFHSFGVAKITGQYYLDNLEEVKALIDECTDANGRCILMLKDIMSIWSKLEEGQQLPSYFSFEEDKKFHQPYLKYLLESFKIYNIKNIIFKGSTDNAFIVEAFDEKNINDNTHLAKALSDFDIEFKETEQGMEINKVSFERFLENKPAYASDPLDIDTLAKKPLRIQCMEYLQEVFNEAKIENVIFKYYDKNNMLLCAANDNRAMTEVLDKLKIAYHIIDQDVAIEEASLSAHVLKVKNDLRDFLFACTLKEMPDFNQAYLDAINNYRQETQNFSQKYHQYSSKEKKEKFRSTKKYIYAQQIGTELVAFEYRPAGRHGQDLLFFTHLVSNNLFGILLDRLKYKPTQHDVSLPRLPRPRTHDEWLECRSKHLIRHEDFDPIRNRLLQSKRVFSMQFKVENDCIPNGKILAQLSRLSLLNRDESKDNQPESFHQSTAPLAKLFQLYYSTLEHKELPQRKGSYTAFLVGLSQLVSSNTQNKNAAQQVSSSTDEYKNPTQQTSSSNDDFMNKILAELDLPQIPVEVHAKLDQLTDKEGNCKVTLKDFDEILKLMSRNEIKNEPSSMKPK